MKINLEHIYSIINSPKLESHLDIYRKAGFHVNKKTVSHPPGMKNGFVHMGPEYIEFVWMERENEYIKEKSNYHDEFRKHPSPFGFGFETHEIELFAKTLKSKGFKLPPMYSRGPSDSKETDRPWWTFQNFQRRTLPGVIPFALRYETRDVTKARKSYVGKNGIFAIKGITFITNNPVKDAERWNSVFGTKILNNTRNNTSIKLRFHKLNWLKPAVFKAIYGKQAWVPHKGRFTHLRKMALLHLYAENLNKAKKYLDEAGFQTKYVENSHVPGVYVYPLKSDGYAFFISEHSIKEWLEQRNNMNQNLELVRD